VALDKDASVSVLDRVVRALPGGITAKDVLGFDLSLLEAQPGIIGGFDGEFLFSARLDNLASCHAACTALLASGAVTRKTRVIALYDHEEVGSQSAVGARSYFLESILERLALGSPGATSDAKARALAQSLLVSADMAHAVHPNY